MISRKTEVESFIATCDRCGRRGDTYNTRESCERGMRSEFWFVSDVSLIVRAICFVLGKPCHRVLCPVCVEET